MKYRMLVLYNRDNKTLEGLQEMEKVIETHEKTVGFTFHSEDEDLGVNCRAILWCEGFTFNMIVDHKVAVKVYESIIIPGEPLRFGTSAWKEIGSWDCGGIQYSSGRY